jgi:hypothetical protein
MVQDGEVVFGQIFDRAVLVADDDSDLNQASGYANWGSLRRVLRRCKRGKQGEGNRGAGYEEDYCPGEIEETSRKCEPG